jgi:hypothetical protein
MKYDGTTGYDDTHVSAVEASLASNVGDDTVDALPAPVHKEPVLQVGGGINVGVFVALIGMGLEWYAALAVFAVLMLGDIVKRGLVTPWR